MRTKLIIIVFIGVVVGLAQGASAIMIVHTFGSEFSGSGGYLSGPVVVTIDDGGVLGSVNVTVDATGLDSSLAELEFIEGLYLNLDPSIDPASLSALTPNDNSDPEVTSFGLLADGFRPDGDGYFDILVDWQNSDGDPGRLQAGETDVVRFELKGLTALDFEFDSQPGPGSTPGPFRAVLRAQTLGLGGEDSGWFSPTSSKVIPEPSTLAIWSLLGTVGISVGWWRRRRQAA
jgi:hypothetical protein